MVTVADGLNACFLLLYAILLGPLGILKGPLLLERALVYVWVLAPYGYLSRFVRAAIDWRLANFEAAIAEVEAIIFGLELHTQDLRNSRQRRVLEDLYTLATRAYLHVGRIDDAMLQVIRAKKSIGVERLPGLADLNAKTAHLIRAGLSAGRLLDGGGLATLFVKTPGSGAPPSEKAPQLPARQGATAHPAKPSDDLAPEHSGKVIQFPSRPKDPQFPR